MIKIKEKLDFLIHDLGMLIFLFSIFFGSILLGNSSEEYKFEITIMFLLMMINVMFASFEIYNLAVIFVGLQVIIYTSYKLFLYYAEAVPIELISYFWLLIPIFAVAGMIMYSNSSMRIDLGNRMLRKQIEKHNLIEPLTGLYNLKSLLIDLKRNMSLSKRNKISISLIIIALKYSNELKVVLSKGDFNIVKQRMADLVQESLRLEDRVYSIDNEGTLAIIATTDQVGGEVIYRKIKNKVENELAFKGIVDRSIKVQVQIAFKEYSYESFGTDSIAFKKRVENELQYDV